MSSLAGTTIGYQRTIASIREDGCPERRILELRIELATTTQLHRQQHERRQPPAVFRDEYFPNT
jgi:hypothetical protein